MIILNIKGLGIIITTNFKEFDLFSGKHEFIDIATNS